MEGLYAEIDNHAQQRKTSISKVLYVMDFEQFSLNQISGDAHPMLSKLCNFGNSKYTNTVYRIYVVRAPMIFQFAWNVIQQWTDPATKQKVCFTMLSFYKLTCCQTYNQAYTHDHCMATISHNTDSFPWGHCRDGGRA